MGGGSSRIARRAVRMVAGATLLLGVVGMGSFGGGGRENGVPLRDFRATLTDDSGLAVAADHVSVGGDTVLEGEMGRGRLRIPFDNIARIQLEPSGKENRDRLRAQVTLREGEPVSLLVRSSVTFYGQVPSGAYQIRARDLRSVEFTR